MLYLRLKITAALKTSWILFSRRIFVSYFLINRDMAQYARHRNFFYVGRGSRINSILADGRGTIDVDPVELDLYF